jgi:nitrite reductase (NADH) small subunit
MPMNSSVSTTGRELAREWIEVGRLDDLPRLGARVVHRRDGNIAVFRTAADEVFALLDRCPHRGGPLSQGIVFGTRVACPLHDWSVDLKTGLACAPDEGCTRRFPVKLEAGRIFLSLTAENAFATAEPSSASA